MPVICEKPIADTLEAAEGDGDYRSENWDAVCDYPELSLCAEQAGVGSYSGGGTVGTASAYRGTVRL